MATEEEEKRLDELLQWNIFKECMNDPKIEASGQSSNKVQQLVDNLKFRLIDAIQDPKKGFAAIAGVLALIGLFMPCGLPFTITASTIKGILIVCEFCAQKAAKVKVIEQQTSIDVDDDIRKKTFAINGALAASIRCLQTMHKRKLNDYEIEILLSQVPRDTGTEFLGTLEYKIKELQKRNGEKKAKGSEEKEEETLRRCNTIISLTDLYCTLSCLREFLMYYLVTVLINSGVPENITDNYLERRERFKSVREDFLKVLYEPAAREAAVAAVFSHSKWPNLREQLGLRPDFRDLIDCPLKIVSVSDETFSMSRYDPDTWKLFTSTKYIRVMGNDETKFVLVRSECNQGFRIQLHKHRDITWTISGSRDAQLETSKKISPDEKGYFNIVRLANGNVMFSSKKRPTCFIKMEAARDDARLCAVNNSFEDNCQWKLVKSDKG